MSPESTSKPTKICPTCGTRVAADAARCLVCGANLVVTPTTSKMDKGVQGSRMPQITLSLPAALGIFVVLLVVIGIGGFVLYRNASPAGEGVPATPTVTLTPTASLTPTPLTPTPTFTPLPTSTPIVYTVKLGDSCGGIAFAFGVSIQSIVLLNNLPADCTTLFEGQKLLIPAPTPTPTSLPTSTLSVSEATEAACEKFEHIVQENDTLSSIAFTYNVSIDAIREYNGLINDVVRFNQKLIIPLCRRNATPGPTPTPTPPPPYPPANLLLPPDGAAFTLGDETITLQWASVGTLRENEAYAVTVEDLTGGTGLKLVDYVADTKFIVPGSFRVNDNIPHIYRWWVLPVRQTGTDSEGNPIWETAGVVSAARVFTWTGVPSQLTPTP